MCIAQATHAKSASESIPAEMLGEATSHAAIAILNKLLTRKRLKPTPTSPNLRFPTQNKALKSIMDELWKKMDDLQWQNSLSVPASGHTV